MGHRLRKTGSGIEDVSQRLLSRFAIGDLATKHFAYRGVFRAGRGYRACCRAVNTIVQTTMGGVTESDYQRIIGRCEKF